MISCACDLHIHSCLSPCGDNDMTPNNLANMAALSGCEIIAITDHNTCKNAPAVMKAGEAIGLLVVPGMELCTSEEAHVVCLFETLEGAMEFDSYIYKNMPHIQNRADIFGEQRMLDENDEFLGLEENLLLVSSFVSVNEVKALAEQYGGTAFPAHVDRDSYSVTAALGSIPAEAGFASAEVTRDCDLDKLKLLYPELEGMRIVRDSDAHYLESLTGEPGRLTLPEKTVSAVVNALRNGLSVS